MSAQLTQAERDAIGPGGAIRWELGGAQALKPEEREKLAAMRGVSVPAAHLDVGPAIDWVREGAAATIDAVTSRASFGIGGAVLALVVVVLVLYLFRR